MVPFPAAPLLTDTRRPTVGPGTREDSVTMPDVVYIAPVSSVSLVECIAIVLSCRRRQSLLCTWSTSRQCLPCLWRQFQPRARRQRQCWMHRDGTRQVCDACSSRVRTCLPWLSCVSSAIATTSVVSEVTAPAVHAAPASVASHCASACRD